MVSGSDNIKSINGIKGWICLLVMFEHYRDFYKYAESFPVRISIIDKWVNSKLYVMTTGLLWVVLFYVISGYLVARSEVTSLPKLIKRIVVRFLRLGLSVFFTYCVIYVIYLIFGFHVKDVMSLMENKWLFSNYTEDPTIKTVLLSPVDVLLRGKPTLASPFWCLSGIFYSSCIIYVYKYVCARFKGEKFWFYYLAAILIFFTFFRFNGVRMACLIGLAVYMVTQAGDFAGELKKSSLFWFAALVVVLSFYVLREGVAESCVVGIALVLIMKCDLLNRFFSSKPMQMLGTIGWGVFGFHFPVFCSVGILIFLNRSEKMGYTGAYFTAVTVCIIITVTLAALYSLSFGKLESLIIKKVRKIIAL